MRISVLLLLALAACSEERVIRKVAGLPGAIDYSIASGVGPELGVPKLPMPCAEGYRIPYRTDEFACSIVCRNRLEMWVCLWKGELDGKS